MACTTPQHDLSDLPDEALWQAYVDGADEAFAQVRRRYQQDLFRYLVLSLSSTALAARELGRVLAGAAAFRRPPQGFDSLKGWLFAIATQGASPAHAGHEEGLLDSMKELARTESGTRHERVLLALRDLRRADRQPFLLVTVAGLSFAEAARACRFSVERTRRAVARAYRQLTGAEVFVGE